MERAVGADEEERLLDMVVGLSQFEVVYALLAKLVSIRTNSDRIRNRRDKSGFNRDHAGVSRYAANFGYSSNPDL